MLLNTVVPVHLLAQYWRLQHLLSLRVCSPPSSSYFCYLLQLPTCLHLFIHLFLMSRLLVLLDLPVILLHCVFQRKYFLALQLTGFFNLCLFSIGVFSSSLNSIELQGSSMLPWSRRRTTTQGCKRKYMAVKKTTETKTMISLHSLCSTMRWSKTKPFKGDHLLGNL